MNKELKKIAKEMKYRKDRMVECLYEERTDDDYLILIVSLGTHPCAYIGLPKGHLLEGVSYEELEDDECYIDVHGGLTYSQYNVAGFNKFTWFFGWDYSHLGDYVPWIGDEESILSKDSKMWTIEEIYEDCLKCINDIKNIQIEENQITKKIFKLKNLDKVEVKE